MDWIPVSEKPPSSSGEYIVTVVNHLTGKRFVTTYDFEAIYASIGARPWGFWNHEDGEDYWYEVDNVIAWAPMPGPYKEDKTNE